MYSNVISKKSLSESILSEDPCILLLNIIFVLFRPQKQELTDLTETLNLLLDEDLPASEVQVFVNHMPQTPAKHSEGGGAFGR